MESNKINRLKIRDLWGNYNLVWDNIDPEVNILLGINGSGKSTVLNIIEEVLLQDKKVLNNKKYGADIYIQGNGLSFSFENGLFTCTFSSPLLVEKINTFDVPVKNKSKLNQNESPLMQELKDLIYQTGKGTSTGTYTGAKSFNDYRLLATNSESQSKKIKARIDKLFSLINELFRNTDKKIEIDTFTNKIIFRTKSETLQLEQLSSGEKQLLLILFKVFLMDELPYILLMDEPELSLHISWQQDLIRVLTELNPNCQYFIATHSPSILGKGWGEKVTYIEDLKVE